MWELSHRSYTPQNVVVKEGTLLHLVMTTLPIVIHGSDYHFIVDLACVGLDPVEQKQINVQYFSKGFGQKRINFMILTAFP